MGFLISCHIIVNDLQAIKTVEEYKRETERKAGRSVAWMVE